MKKAKVTRENYAVPDGAVYPRVIQLGEIIHGDLAEVAIRDKWGTAHFEEGDAAAPVLVEKKPSPAAAPHAAAPPAAAKPEAAKPEAARPEAEAHKSDAVAEVDHPGPVDIPDDWRALKWPELKALTERVKNGPIANKDEAQAIIETELSRRETALAQRRARPS